MSARQERYIPNTEEIKHAEESLTELQKVMTDVHYEVFSNPEYRGKKVVFIMRGVPGSGKSTIARELAHPEGVIHSTDQYFYNEKGEYKFDPTKISENHRKNFEAFCKSLDDGKPIIIVDNTNIKRFHFQQYINAAKERGYEVKEVETPTPEPAQAAKRNFHGVPEQTIRRMLDQYDK